MFNFKVELLFKDAVNASSEVSVVKFVSANDFTGALNAAKEHVRRYGLYGAWAWSAEVVKLGLSLDSTSNVACGSRREAKITV